MRVPVFSSPHNVLNLSSHTTGLIGLPCANPLCPGIASMHLE